MQPAFILHHRPYRETSLILELFTQNDGRIAVIGKGARAQCAALRGILQPFSPLVVSWKGRGELPTLCTAEPHDLPLRLRGENLLSGFYLKELLMRLLQKNDAYPKLFHVYSQTLLTLQKPYFHEKTLRFFEIKLLEELDYGLQLQNDLKGQPLLPDKYYRFHPEKGFDLQDHPEITPFVFYGESLLAVARNELALDAFGISPAVRFKTAL